MWVRRERIEDVELSGLGGAEPATVRTANFFARAGFGDDFEGDFAGGLLAGEEEGGLRGGIEGEEKLKGKEGEHRDG